MKSTLWLTSTCAIGALAAFSGRTYAQVAPASGGATNNQLAGNPDIAEIVVTAQKRAENINSVGMAITANTGLQLQQKGVTSVSDLTKIEPSLQFSQSQSGTPVYTLRGVGYFEQSLAASPTVSLYQDEVAFPYPVMARGVLLDPERVEILKGPQGTLYGQNATGGAVNFIAAKPTETFHAGIDGSYGRFNDALVSGFVSGPLTPTLTARVAGSLELASPWQKSNTRDAELGAKDTQIGRVILQWKPSSTFTARLNANGWIDHSDTQAGQIEGFRLQAPQNVQSGNPSDPAFYVPAPVGSATFNSYPQPLQGNLSEPVSPNKPRAADWLRGTHPQNDEHFYQANLRLDWNPSDALGVTSITNYEHFNEHNIVDSAGNAGPTQTAYVNGRVNSFSQELRLHGVLMDNRFNWLVGANYARDKSYENDSVDPFVSTGSYSPAALGLGPFLQFGAINTDLAKTYSVFANAEWKILDSVSVHGGIRYTKSDQAFTGCSYSTYPSVTIVQNAVGAELAGLYGGTSIPADPGTCVTLGPAPNFIPGLQHNDLKQHNVPWRVGIDWKPIDKTLLYVTVSKGYKAGSAPTLGASQYYQLIPVTQESLLAYEGGIKTELFDRTLQLTASYFHYDYTNKQELGRLQDPVYGSLQTLLNIPKSKEDGAEFSIVWRPMHGVTLNGAGTYLKSKVTSDFFEFGPYPLGANDKINFKGESFPYTPKFSAQFGARYDWNLNDRLVAFVSGDGSYQSKSHAVFGYTEAEADNAPSFIIRPYTLFNLTAGVGAADGKWRVELWGKNITNKYYWTSVNYISDETVRLAGLPATYGARVSFRY